MVGLDVTHRVRFTPAVAARLAAVDTAAAGPPLAFFGDAHRRAGRLDSSPIHDAVAVAVVIEPTLATSRDALVQVGTSGRLTAGMTVVDFAPGAGAARHHVGGGLDVERFWELVLRALSALP